MMNAKREMRIQPVATAALILGLLALNPFTAFAADRQGLTLQELQSLTDGEFEVSREGDQLKVAGSVPASCLVGATATYGVMEGDKHMVTIDFPNCRDGRSKNPKEPKASISEAFIPGLPININTSKSGKFFLRHLNAGDPAAKRKPEPEELLDFQGNPITVESRADREARIAREKDEARKADEEKLAEERKKAQEAEEAKRAEARQIAIDRENQERAEILSRMESLCQQGDFVGLGEEIMKARRFIGDVTTLLGKVDIAQKNRLLKDLKGAKDAESLRAVYDQYVAAAEQKAWDTDDVQKLFVDRRIELVKETVSLVASKEKSASEAASEVRGLISDLKEIDRSLLRKNKAQIGWMYSEIATGARNNGKHDDAEKYYTEAEKYVDADSKQKLEGEMSKMYLDDWKSCVDKNKLKPAACDKLAAKAKAHAKGAIDAAKAQGSSEDDAEGVQAMSVEYIGTFGLAGPSMKVQGFGDMSLNQAGAGAIEQYKKAKYVEGVQEQQLKQMQQMMGGAGGMGMMSPNGMLNSPLGAGIGGSPLSF